MHANGAASTLVSADSSCARNTAALSTQTEAAAKKSQVNRRCPAETLLLGMDLLMQVKGLLPDAAEGILLVCQREIELG